MKFTKALSVDLASREGSYNYKQALVKSLFQSGLQEIISILIGLSLADLTQRQEVPSGLCGRFSRALTKPVLGTMLDFLIWTHKNAQCNGLPEIHSYLLKVETKNEGWFKQIIGLRKKWAGHLKDKTDEELALQGLSILDETPDFDSWGYFEQSSEGNFLWTGQNSSLPLHPFLFLEGETVCFPREFTLDGQLKFSCNSHRLSSEFEKWWSDATEGMGVRPTHFTDLNIHANFGNFEQIISGLNF